MHERVVELINLLEPRLTSRSVSQPGSKWVWWRHQEILLNHQRDHQNQQQVFIIFIMPLSWITCLTFSRQKSARIKHPWKIVLFQDRVGSHHLTIEFFDNFQVFILMWSRLDQGIYCFVVVIILATEIQFDMELI